MAADNSQVANTIVKTADWKSVVAEVEDLNEPHDAYEFTNKTFKETDSDGVYTS